MSPRGAPGEPRPVVPGFALRALIGRGAVGTVWAATRVEDGRRFAVKVVPGAAAQAATAQAMRESGVLSRLDNPHVVRLERALALQDGSLALVLQLASGGNLAQVVTSRGHLSPGETVTILAPLAGALADLHTAGVVHSDLSPGNVLFTADGMPLLGDLGVARLIGELPEQVHGTSGFVAPEVERGQLPGLASDVYALGALGWYALTGSAPPPPAVRPQLHEQAPQAPARLVRAIETCMAADPLARPGAAQAAVDLYDAAAPEAVQLAAGADAGAALTHRLRADAAHSVAPVPSGRRRPPRALLVAGLAVLLILAGTTTWWFTRTAPPRTQAATYPAPGLGSTESFPPAGSTPSASTPSASTPSASTPSASTPSASSPAAAIRSASTPAGASPTADRQHLAAPVGDLTASRKAAVTAPAALAGQLADRRTAALVSRDVSALSRVDVSASPAWRADAEVIDQLVRRGGSYRGLTTDARSVTVLEDAGSRVTVRATVATSGYTYQQAGTAPQARSGSVRTVLLHLQWTHRAWRIASVS